MAFGAAFSQFTLDDSNVLMYDDVYGEVEELVAWGVNPRRRVNQFNLDCLTGS